MNSGPYGSQNMEIAELLKRIRGQCTAEGIVAVRGYQNVVRTGGRTHGKDHRRVLKTGSVKRELHQITGQQCLSLAGHAHGAPAMPCRVS